MAFAYLWQYQVEVSSVVQFEAAYGPEGSWVRLFRKFPGYLRTELLQDADDPLRYSTIDFWQSRQDYLAFRAAAAAEFERIDLVCASLTRAETHLGDFETVDSAIHVNRQAAGMPPRLLAAIPKLASLNIERSLTFLESLGFARSGGYPDYGVAELDGVQIHFWLCQDARIPSETACRIAVDGIEELFAAYSEMGVIHPNGSLALKPWGVWEFSVLDPDGNLITFQQSAT